MPAPIRPIGHEERLSLVEHLDELRSRLIICAVVLVVTFAGCAAFNDQLLSILNDPLEKTTQQSIEKGRGPPGQIERTQQAVRALGRATDAAIAAIDTPSSRMSRGRAQGAARAARRSCGGRSPTCPRTQGNKPVTLRRRRALRDHADRRRLYFAILISLPVILFQLYAFVLPAFSPSERRVALPLMSMVPVLFVCGVVFGYFVVLPPGGAVPAELQRDEFNVLVQAQRLLQVRGAGAARPRPAVPDTGRGPGADPAGGHDRRASCGATAATRS